MKTKGDNEIGTEERKVVFGALKVSVDGRTLQYGKNTTNKTDNS